MKILTIPMILLRRSARLLALHERGLLDAVGKVLAMPVEAPQAGAPAPSPSAPTDQPAIVGRASERHPFERRFHLLCAAIPRWGVCSPLIFGAALPAEMEELLVARLAGTDALSELVDAALQASVAAAPG